MPCENQIIDFAAEKIPQAEILPIYPDAGIYLPDTTVKRVLDPIVKMMGIPKGSKLG